MPTALYRIRTGTTATNLGRELLSALETIAQGFSALERLRAALIQEKDGAAGDATDWVTPATQFGITDGSDAISSTVAMAAFAEIDSFYSNGGAALTQCCARFKQ